jgi:tRNA A-37 threonylcarbamoyl transferase component Bud32
LTDRWRRVGELFDQIVSAPRADREALLDASPEPDDIKQEVRSLLTAHDRADDFLAPGEMPVGDAPSHSPGSTVGPYRIVRLIGRGGMGVVYEAVDTRLHRRVALKALPPEVAADERQRQRLRREARAAAALQHPGIATVYALEELDGEVFISAELLSGETLRAEIARGKADRASLIRDGIALARALCAAHEQGVVHRDLKPENIVRAADGSLKILDFGLAQFEARAEDDGWSRLTLAGTLLGTPTYMAPEQLLGRETDFRVDQFAFGVLLYELGTGVHPFAAVSLPSTMARILADAPDPPPHAAAIPTEVWTVIERCLQKDPAGRFVTTRDMLHALERAPRAPGPSAPRAPRAPGAPGPGAALRWWRFHQLTAALAYWAMVWPVWHVHRSLGRAGLFFFFVTLAAVVMAGSLRLHLWFSSRVYPEDLLALRTDVSPWIRWADLALVALLLIGGIALPDDRTAWAALLISFAVGAAVACIFVEPATARAAFRPRS